VVAPVFPFELAELLEGRRIIMTRLELDPAETGMLREVLESFLSDLRLEVADTEKMAFREGLKKKEVFLKDVLTRLKGAEA